MECFSIMVGISGTLVKTFAVLLSGIFTICPCILSWVSSILDITVISGGCLALGGSLEGILHIMFASIHLPAAIINLINTIGFTVADILNCIAI